MSGARPIKLALAAMLGALLLGLSSGVANAQAIEDDGGASWHLQQPPPPEPPPGVEGSSTPVGLGRIGDIEFWAPNRGLLITAGNGSTIPPGVWAYNGRAWHELSNVCGGSDGRIAWAGPDEFWTISDGRAGQPPDAHGNPAPLLDNTLCHFAGGRVVASYGSLAFRSNSYQPMHAAGCISANDCWFAGDPLPPPQVGAFQLHWDGGSVTAEAYPQEGYAVDDARAFEGQLYESVQLSKLTGEEPFPLLLVNPVGVAPTFEALTRLPLYGPEEFATALSFLHLSSAEGALWAAAGPVAEAPSGSAPGQVTVARYSSGQWYQQLGPSTVPSGAELFPGRVVDGIAAEPGTESAWVALDTSQDAERPSPTAYALAARIKGDGSVSKEDVQRLPAGEEVGPKGAAEKIACPAVSECWLATEQGWLFHLSNGSQLPEDTDPAFAGLITYRPEDEGVPKVLPDAPPPDTSGLLGELPPSSPPPETTPQPEARTPIALLSHLRTRVLRGHILELRFHLAVRARIKLIARHGKRTVGSTPTRTLAAGERSLQLSLNRRRWPTKLELKTHALAPLPTVSAKAGSAETLTTRLAKLPDLSRLLGSTP